MDFRFDDFIKQGLYLKAWSPKTVRTYRQGLNAFQMALGELQGSHLCLAADHSAPFTKAHLDAFVISMRQRGLAPGGCNMYIRTVNSYLTWLHEEGHLPAPLKIKLLPDPRKPLRGFSDAEIRLLLNYKPRGPHELRTWTLVVLLVDTGIRIEEALSLTSANVDLGNLFIKVLGKGSKERLVPISIEGRKTLFRFRAHMGHFLFVSKSGTRLLYRNAFRDIKRICKKAGVEGEHVHPHAFRHCFAVTYIRKGGDVYRLSRILGHASISTTSLYLRSMGIEHLKENHSALTPLARF